MRNLTLFYLIRKNSNIGSNFNNISKTIKKLKFNNPNLSSQPLSIDSPGYSFRQTLKKSKQDRENYSPYSG